MPLRPDAFVHDQYRDISPRLPAQFDISSKLRLGNNAITLALTCRKANLGSTSHFSPLASKIERVAQCPSSTSD
ncbi:MAG TPA: hypothetical protein VG498_15900 [Terriglobales bacterium]|nr:hypothetical protein [Terriglobales bacterium]